MGITTSKRVSVKAFLLPYLDEIGAELGTTDYSEICHQIITEHKRFIQKSLAAYSSGIIEIPTPAQVRAMEKPKKFSDDDALASSLDELLNAA
jgi:hypothetical protein